MTFDTVESAIDAVRRGEFVVVVDDEDRENEGDLIIAAEKMTPDKMAFMIRYTSGVICLPMEGARLDELRLPLMVAGSENTEGQLIVDTNPLRVIDRTSGEWDPSVIEITDT